MSAATIGIRRATPHDLEALTFFCDTVLRRDYFIRKGQLREMLEGTRHQVFVGELDRVLVALAVVTRPGRLVNALVHPAYRRLGIGRALLRVVAPREIRVKKDMHSGDPSAFYQRLGYQPTGESNERGNIELFTAASGSAARSASE